MSTPYAQRLDATVVRQSAVFARYGHHYPIDDSGVMRRQPSGIHHGGAARMIRSPWLASPRFSRYMKTTG